MKKKTSSLSPLEHALSQWKTIRMRIESGYMFGKIRTYGKYYQALGRQLEDLNKDDLEKPLTKATLTELLKQEEQKIREKFEAKPEPVVIIQEATQEVAVEPEIIGNVLDYWFRNQLPPNRQLLYGEPDLYQETDSQQHCELRGFQHTAVRSLVQKTFREKKRGFLIRASTGRGKTVIVGKFILELIRLGFFKDCLSPWPIIYVTKNQAVTKTERLLKKFFGLRIPRDVKVINIEQLRSNLGTLMIAEKTVVEHGEAHIVWEWKPIVHPKLLIIDECQIGKNTWSQQSKILQDFTDVWHRYHTDTLVVSMSATPFVKVSEAKVFCCSTRKPLAYGAETAHLSNKIWNDYANEIAAPASPNELSPAAMERLREDMKDYIVEVKNVRTKWKQYNSVQPLSFRTPEQRREYDKAIEDYYKEKAALENSSMTEQQKNICKLTILLKFSMRAELLKKEDIAEFCHQAIQRKKSPIFAMKYIPTICEVTRILIEKYGYSRNDISLIWGGYDEKKLSKKQKVKQSLESSEELMAAMKLAGIDINSLGIKFTEPTIAKKHYPAEYRLGKQDKFQRQTEIDNFQEGRTRICGYTLAAGGTALDLHDEVEATWPREGIISLSYNAIELVQGVGRDHRLTSKSHTYNIFPFFVGTVEEEIAAVLTVKLACLQKVIQTKESWEEIITREHRKLSSQIAYDMQEATDRQEQDSEDEETEGMFIEDEEGEEV